MTLPTGLRKTTVRHGERSEAIWFLRLLRNNNGGLALVEVLVAVAILSAGAIWLLQALARISYSMALVHQQGIVYLFALSKSSEIESTFVHQELPEDLGHGSFDVGKQHFRWSTAYEPLEDRPELKTVDLTIRWTQGSHQFEKKLQMLLKNGQEPL